MDDSNYRLIDCYHNPKQYDINTRDHGLSALSWCSERIDVPGELHVMWTGRLHPRVEGYLHKKKCQEEALLISNYG